MGTSERSAGDGRLMLAGDAFLFAAALDIMLSSLFMIIAALTGFADSDVSPGSLVAIVMQSSFLIATVVVVGGGAFVAWRLHGRGMRPMTGVAMGIGVVAGLAIAMPVFTGVAMLLSRIPIGGRTGPPWLAIALAAALALALLLVPVVDAVRDLLPARRLHVRVDWLRLGALAVVVAIAGVALPLISSQTGSEVAEAGIFMIPFSAAAVFAVLGADIYARFIEKRPVQPT